MTTPLTATYKRAAKERIVSKPDTNAFRRAARAYRHNLDNPGDVAEDDLMLRCLAIAQADVGIHPGWIPEVQRIGMAIAALYR